MNEKVLLKANKNLQTDVRIIPRTALSCSSCLIVPVNSFNKPSLSVFTGFVLRETTAIFLSISTFRKEELEESDLMKLVRRELR